MSLYNPYIVYCENNHMVLLTNHVDFLSRSDCPVCILEKCNAAKQALINIPSWATWTEAEAQTWGDTNIGTPLINGRANLPATLTLATTRTAILAIITILDKMWIMLWALARMVIALRDKNWPDLPEV